MVKYSVITVCLNSEKTIIRCLNSLKNQSFRNFEHIIVDGMSSDQTLKLVKNYNVDMCVSEKDEGIFDAMNKGANLASGNYILFLNSDDEMLPDFLLEVDKVIKSYDFVSSGINMIFSDHIKKWIPKHLVNHKFIGRMPIPHAGLIVKTDVFKDIGGFDLQFKITSDFDFVIKLLRGSYSGVYNEKCLLNFYMGGLSQSFRVIKENHNVRRNNSVKIERIYFSLFLDYLRYFKAQLNFLLIKK